MDDEILDNIDNFDNSGELVEVKKRHGCVTAWLAFGILTNSLVALVYFFMGETILDTLPGSSGEMWMVYTLGLIGIINVVSSILIIYWKKIGFYIFGGTALITVVLNLMLGVNIVQAGMGLSGIFILYVVLQIKDGGKAAWDQMD